MLSELLSSIFPTHQAEEAKEDPPADEQQEEEAPAEEEEEEPEPEDRLPELRTECQESKQCAEAAKHYTHCNEKVEAGEGHKGENCVEELMMHCVDKCVAPKLFAELK
ncbi:hypothetical protein EXIGLDRAFT_830215 [Exidia glandulosa HHB12029]|uniref:Ubiquinol-cytochrome C reductase hinge domain-containing protein n=1 Tax=Exidia glandulosa HHB12029 TaxID=1314781 RepID=A0A165NUW8_EXIGL|nr:hypothetical protein EXIGLDRAFT_830215 [Exidia glandulosa HHB12029]